MSERISAGFGESENGSLNEYIATDGTAAPKKKNGYKTRLFGSALLLAVSILILICSLFAPLSHSKMQINKNVEADIKFSGIDSFTLLYYSTKSYSETQIRKTKLYNETAKLNSVYRFSSLKSLNEKQQEALETATRNTLLLNLVSKESGMRFNVVLAALTLCGFILTDAVLVFRAGKELLDELLNLGKPVKSKKRNCNYSLRILWLLIGLLPMLAYSFKQLSYWGIGKGFGVFSSAGNGLSFGLLIITLLSVFCGAFFVFLSVRAYANADPIPSSVLKKKIALICIVLILLFALFLPIINIGVSSGSGSTSLARTENVKISVGDLFVLESDDINHYRETTAQNAIASIKATIKELISRKSSVSNPNLHNDLVLGVDRNNVSGMYVAIQLVTYLTLLTLAFLLKYSVQALLHNESCAKEIFALKILTGLLALAVSVLNIILFIITYLAVSADLILIISVGFGIGPILCLICAISLFVIKADYGVGEYADDWYDNADVTYAPYVIK